MTKHDNQDAMSSPTEQRNPYSLNIDQLPAEDILALINREDALVAPLVRTAIPVLAEVANAIALCLRKGGSLHYFGAGTSGRMGVLDAAEVPPTYGFPAERMVAHLAGGTAAMVGAVEKAEDAASEGAAIVDQQVGAQDLVFGIAASGTTPFVLGALQAARKRGILTLLLTSNPDSPGCRSADIPIVIPTGPEVITGSTRMKAATAQKLVLQSLSTTVMIMLGRVRSNLMLGMQPTNQKLQRRAVWLVQQLTGQPHDIIQRVLETHGYRIEEALEQLKPVEPVHQPSDTTQRVVGMDIGGSGLRASLLSAATGEALNPQEFRFDTQGSSDSLFPSDALEALRDFVGEQQVLPEQVALVGVGLAGAAHRPDRVEEVSRRLRQLFPTARLVIGNDSLATFIGARGTQAGALLAVGTGAVAVASDGKDTFRRIDGMGFLAGDLGSGSWLGRQGIEHAITGLTRRGPHSPGLEAAFTEQFGSLDHYIHEVHQREAPAALLATFARPVLALASSGDADACALADQAVAHLVETTRQACSDISDTVVLCGGMLAADSWLRLRLVQALKSQGIRPVQAQHSAVIGAALMAIHYASDHLPPALAAQVVDIK